MNSQWRAILVLAGFCLAACSQSPAGTPKSVKQVRRIIRHSQHWGAHGMGYNTESMNTFSRKLTPADVPVLMGLLADKELYVGAQFALSSQCAAAIPPVREAVMQHKMDFLAAEDVLSLIEHFSVCTPETQQRASALRSEIESLAKAWQIQVDQEQKQILAEDARIQRNALRMADPKQAKELTRQEREEVYKRSLDEMGLKEDGPLTPAQKDLIQRMYRTMVLGESGNRPPN